MKYSNQSIIDGSFDDYFRDWAEDANAYGKTVILRYNQEMNGTWFPWSPYAETGSNSKRYYDLGNTPENFAQSWRHIYDIIKPIAPNVQFFWCPHASTLPNLAYTARFFPGAEYVDYIGFDQYQRTEMSTMLDKYKKSVEGLRKLPIPKNTDGSSKIPMIVGETGISAANPDRNKWVSEGYPAVYKNFPEIQAMLYFNLDMRPIENVNWYLASTPSAMLAYVNTSTKVNFQGRFAPYPHSKIPTGFLDSIGSSEWSIKGWVYDPDIPNLPIDVRVYVNGPIGSGALMGIYKADMQRPDLAGVGIPTNHGFKIPIPVQYQQLSNTFYVYAIDPSGVVSATNIKGSPKTASEEIVNISPSPTIGPVGSVSKTIFPKADSYVSSGQASSNFGTDNPMTVQGRNPSSIVFMKFELPDLTGKTVEKAILRFTASNDSEAGVGSGNILSVKSSSNSWTEKNLTNNSKPNLESVVGVRNGAIGTGETVEIDVTPGVVGKNRGDVSLALEATSSNQNNLIIRSKEASSNKPQLIITYR